jgi:hypothetical protein
MKRYQVQYWSFLYYIMILIRFKNDFHQNNKSIAILSLRMEWPFVKAFKCFC